MIREFTTDRESLERQLRAADDKEVEFATMFGKTAVKAKFNLKNMAINGKLGL